jgi:WD40 repeat protein
MTPNPVRFLDHDQIMYVITRTFVIWDLTKSADVLRFTYDGWADAISSDGTRLSSSHGDIVKSWQTRSTNWNQDMSDHHTAQVWCISFSRDGQLVASALRVLR